MLLMIPINAFRRSDKATASPRNSGNDAARSMAVLTLESESSDYVATVGARSSAHPRHCGDQRLILAVPFLQGAADLLFLFLKVAQPRFDQSQLGLALLDQLARLDQAAVDALALGRELVHVRLDLLGA